MDIYNFSPLTGEYLAKAKARLDPLEGKPMIPANATEIAPPRAKAGHVRVFADGAWSQVPDHRGTVYWLDGKEHKITDLGAVVPEGATLEPPQPSREEMKVSALVRIDQAHSQFLRQLTGNATIEERDTWKTKEEAARALIGDIASEGQTAMIGYEAAGAGVEPTVLAQTIIAKAEAFQALIGKAAGLRAKAKAAILQATDEAVPLEQIESALATIFDQLSSEVDAVVAAWRANAA